MSRDETRSRCGACATPTLHADGIGRRTFLAQSAMLAAVTLLAACGAGSDPTAPALSGSATIRVSDFPALASVGGVALATIQGSPFAIVRTSASTFVTLSRICPHQGGTVNTSGSGFLCPNHGAQFGPTGTWAGGEQTSNLRSYPTTFDASAGTLTIG